MSNMQLPRARKMDMDSYCSRKEAVGFAQYVAREAMEVVLARVVALEERLAKLEAPKVELLP